MDDVSVPAVPSAAPPLADGGFVGGPGASLRRGLAALIVAGLGSAAWWPGTSASTTVGSFTVLVGVVVLWSVLARQGAALLLGVHGLTGLGGTCVYIASERLGLHPAFGALVAVVVVGSTALGLACLLSRAPGPFAAVLTLVAAELLSRLARRVAWLGGDGPHELDVSVRLPGLDRAWLLWLGLAVGVGGIALGGVLHRSRHGLVLRANTDDPRAATSLGLPVPQAQRRAMVAAGALFGLAGAVKVLQVGAFDAAAAFGVRAWILPVLALAAVGGLGSVDGAVVATLLYVLWDRFGPGHADLLLRGVILLGVVVLAVSPEGLGGLLRRFGVVFVPSRSSFNLRAEGVEVRPRPRARHAVATVARERSVDESG